ncbi:MAG TPA: hypothetical protein VK582_12020 [Pyrinomonadaceae bacterium]|nr:hypothetical protein [Pyrinomonadaceae bacterium]
MTTRMCSKWTVSCTLFLSIVAFGTASGQSTSEAASNIEILKLKWEKQTRLPKDFDPSVIPTGIIFSEPAAQTIRPGTSAATNASRDVALAQSHPSTQETGTFGNAPSRMPVFYVYSMKIRNIGAKTIEGMAWDYDFLDSLNNVVLGRHQILSFTKLAPEKITTVEAPLRVPPIPTIQAQNARDQKNEKFLERAVIQCVLYADQTTWKSMQAPEGVCEVLKKTKAGLKH